MVQNYLLYNLQYFLSTMTFLKILYVDKTIIYYIFMIIAERLHLLIKIYCFLLYSTQSGDKIF